MNKWLKILILILGLTAIVLSSGRFLGKDIFKSDSKTNEEQTEKESLFKEIIHGYSYYNHDKTQDLYHLYNENNELISNVLFSSPYCDDIKGFGGNVPFVIILDDNNTILKINLLENSESESWIKNLYDKKFFDNWEGLSVHEASNKEVDIISGATYTTEAIINSVDLRLSIFLDDVAKTKKNDIVNTIGIIASFLVLIFAIISFIIPKQSKVSRFILLFASVGILGFWQGDFLSLALLHNWLINGLDIKVQIFIFTLLIISVLLPIISNKSFYCQYVCPFGAVQELAGSLNKRKLIFGYNFTKILRNVKFIFLLIILVLLIVAVDIKLEDFEPFAAFNFKFASLFVIILALVMIFLSIFVNKPWCRFFCPTGAVLSLLRGKSKRLKHVKIDVRIILNIIFVFIIGILIILLILKSKKAADVIDLDMEKEKTALEIIYERKSVRNYTNQKIEKELLEELVRAGMAAPSARNLQPWVFVIIENKETMASLADSLPYAKMLKNAQAAIVVCGDLSKAATDIDQAYWVQDCCAATQNILLAAESLGLGAVWTATYPYKERVSPVRYHLNLPENIIPLNVIPIGYPTGEDKPKDKWKPENIHWEKW